MKTTTDEYKIFKQRWVSTTPAIVPSSENTETEEQLKKRYEKFIKLPLKIRYLLSFVGTSEKIISIGQKYNFELLRLANISRLIREYYFGEVKLENFPREIEKRMGVSLFTAQEITRYIKQEIIDWDPVVEYLGQMSKIAIREIIKNYPDIAKQKITDRELELKGGLDWDDPTIENWIHDYTQHLGQGQHSAIDRMNYLFHSENTGRLTSPERDKLGIILKSFDENLPLPVDEENKEIPLDYLIPEQSQNTKHGTWNMEHGTHSTSSQPQVQRNLAQPIPAKPYIPPIQSNPINPAPQPFQSKPAPPKQEFVKPYPQINPASAPSPQAEKPFIPTPPPMKPRQPEHLDFSNPYPQPETHNTLNSFSSPISRFSEPEPSANILPVGNSYPLDHIPESDTIAFKNKLDEPRNPVKPKLPNLEEPPRRASVINFFQTPEKFGSSPVEIKSFTEHQTPKNVPPSQPTVNTPASPPTAKVVAPEEPKKSFSSYTFTPPPHNIIHPHMYDNTKKEKPEPKLDGNIVDLSKL